MSSNRLSEVKHNCSNGDALRFVISTDLNDELMPTYVKEFKLRKVSDVVRVCKPGYGTTLLEENGIRVHVSIFQKMH